MTGESILITGTEWLVIREIGRVHSVVPKARQRRRELGVEAKAGPPGAFPRRDPKMGSISSIEFSCSTSCLFNALRGARLGNH